MGSVMTVAMRELKSGFSSPKSTAIFFFFLGIMGLFFNAFVSAFAEMQARAPMMGGQAPTYQMFLQSLYYNAHFTLILFVPAVTMGMFAEERKNQSLRLLMTAPITASQIVLGKFFAGVTTMGLMLAASAVFPLFLLYYGNPDGGVILSSYIGLFLLVCAYLAFGIWVSSLCKSQFMAFLFTMFGLFLLMIVNWLAPNMTGSDVGQELLKYVASTEHLDVFLKGMITVSDVTYFLTFMALFLFFTNVVIDSQRWR